MSELFIKNPSQGISVILAKYEITFAYIGKYQTDDNKP